MEAGAEVDVNTPIAIIADADEYGMTPNRQRWSPPSPGWDPDHCQLASGGARACLSCAKRLAHELGIDLALVTGTGEDGLYY